jgi:hypothetical protein
MKLERHEDAGMHRRVVINQGRGVIEKHGSSPEMVTLSSPRIAASVSAPGSRQGCSIGKLRSNRSNRSIASLGSSRYAAKPVGDRMA